MSHIDTSNEESCVASAKNLILKHASQLKKDTSVYGFSQAGGLEKEIDVDARDIVQILNPVDQPIDESCKLEDVMIQKYLLRKALYKTYRQREKEETKWVPKTFAPQPTKEIFDEFVFSEELRESLNMRIKEGEHADIKIRIGDKSYLLKEV